VQDLSATQWLPPCQPGVYPIAWVLAHISWVAGFRTVAIQRFQFNQTEM
jgi:hypothetical protein